MQPYYSDTTNVIQQQYDFTNISTDLFQPEEIFQLDQPIKSDFISCNQNEVNTSPSTLLDLGSGAIHKEYKNEFWNQGLFNVTNDDSNQSCCSRFLSSPDNSQLLGISSFTPTKGDGSVSNIFEVSKMEDLTQKYRSEKELPVNSFVQSVNQNNYKFVSSETEARVSFNQEHLNNLYIDHKLDEKCNENFQFIDYGSFEINDYKSTNSNNELVLNEIEFRTENNHFSSDCYEILPH